MRRDRQREDAEGNDNSSHGVVSRRRLLAAGGAAAVTAVGGCLGGTSGDGGDGGDSGDTPTDTATPTPTPTERIEEVTYRNRYKRLGIGTGMNDAAVEMGLWTEEGVDVSFKASSGSSAAAKSVASGQDTFGNGEAAAPLKLMEQAESLVIIGQQFNPMEGVVTTGEGDISTWSDLEGKTVGKAPQGGNIGKAVMRRQGVDLSKVTFQNVQPGSGTQVLLAGEVDAMLKWFVLEEPRLEKRGYDPTVLPLSQAADYLGVTLFTRREVIENQPEVVNEFVRGWLKANQTFANNIDRVFEIYGDLASEYYSEELNREALPRFYSALVPPKSVGQEYGKGYIPESKVQETMNILEEAGLIEGSTPVEDAYTNRFIEQNRDLAVETANALYDRLEEYDIGPTFI